MKCWNESCDYSRMSYVIFFFNIRIKYSFLDTLYLLVLITYKKIIVLISFLEIDGNAYRLHEAFLN